MDLPWTCGPALDREQTAWLHRRAVFDCCKWHTQADDRPVLCPFPLVLDDAAWAEVCGLAEALARETLAAERELLTRADLHQRLGLPRPLRQALWSIATAGATRGAARLMRFDFHWTREGWRISEANTDAAGGFVEASGVTRLMAQCCAAGSPAGDPAGALAEALARAVGDGGAVALMHQTVYSEGRQVMLYVARRLREQGLAPSLVSPEQLRWEGGHAEVECATHQGPVQAVLRFFPAEWLPGLPRGLGWPAFFAGGLTPVCNPACAVLTQSKRFALTWDELATPLPTWRVLLPETRNPAAVRNSLDNWVLKPALGHEGRDVALAGVSNADDWQRIRSAALRDEAAWAAQRRFETLPLPTPDGPLYPCLGVYAIDGRVAGAYGRVAPRPLIDDRSREVVVLVCNNRCAERHLPQGGLHAARTHV
jgi:glutathionylspermidine synthase